MRAFLNAAKGLTHPEERPAGRVSKDAPQKCSGSCRFESRVPPARNHHWLSLIPALGFSVSLHVIVLAAIAQAWKTEPPETLAVIAVDLMPDSDIAPAAKAEGDILNASSDVADESDAKEIVESSPAKPIAPSVAAEEVERPDPESVAAPWLAPAPRRKPAAPVPVGETDRVSAQLATARSLPEGAVHARQPQGLAALPAVARAKRPTTGSSVGAVIPARYSGGGLSNPPPRYPYRARQRGQEGRVILRVRVTASGEPSTVSVRQSSGYRLLDEAALAAVKRWQFTPARQSGVAVAGWLDVPFAFKLTD